MTEIIFPRRRKRDMYGALILLVLVAVGCHLFAAFTTEIPLRLALELDIFFLCPLLFLPGTWRQASLRFYEEAVSQRDLLGRRRTMRWSDIVDVDYEPDHARLIGRGFVVYVRYGAFESGALVPELIDRLVPAAAVERGWQRRVERAERRRGALKNRTVYLALVALNFSLLPIYGLAVVLLLGRSMRFLVADELSRIICVSLIGYGVCSGAIATWNRSAPLGAILQVIAVALTIFVLRGKLSFFAIVAFETILLFTLFMWLRGKDHGTE